MSAGQSHSVRGDLRATRSRLLALIVCALAVLLAVSAGCGTTPVVALTADAAPAGDAPIHVGPVLDASTALACTAACNGLCGDILDSCGNVTDCGGCEVGQVCGVGGPNHCGVGTCTPYCAPKSCGSDGCADVCGRCAPGQTCSGGRCICDPTLCQGCCQADGTCDSTCACGSYGQACCNGVCAAGLSCDPEGQCTLCTNTIVCTVCGQDDGCGHPCKVGACLHSSAQCVDGVCTCECDGGCCNGIDCVHPPSPLGLCGSNGLACEPCWQGEPDSGEPDSSAASDGSDRQDGAADAGSSRDSGGPGDSASSDTGAPMDPGDASDATVHDSGSSGDAAMDSEASSESGGDVVADGPADGGTTEDGGKGGGCFPAGTPVARADGASVPIESLHPGDRVESLEPRAGRVVSARVLQVVRHEPVDTGGTLLVVNGMLTTTVDHPFFADGHAVRADDLSPGMSLLLLSDKGMVRREGVRSVERRPASVPTYELRVEGSGIYFTAAYAVMQKLTHN